MDEKSLANELSLVCETLKNLQNDFIALREYTENLEARIEECENDLGLDIL